MSIKIVRVKIRGTTALLMHAYPMIPLEAAEKKSPEERAEYACYREPGGSLYIPGINIQRCLVAAAAYSKGKGRASLQKPVAACVMIAPERCILDEQTYQIDIRPVVIPATKGRVLRHRPRFDRWGVEFEIEYDDNLLKESELRQVVDDAGVRVGLLDFRPERKGSFGRIMVVEWKS